MAITKIIRGIPEPWQFEFGFDITGHTIVLFVKKNISDDDDTYVYKDTFVTHADNAAGLTAERYQSGDSTKSIPKGIYWFEARDFDADGNAYATIGPEKIEYTTAPIKGSKLTDL